MASGGKLLVGDSWLTGNHALKPVRWSSIADGWIVAHDCMMFSSCSRHVHTDWWWLVVEVVGSGELYRLIVFGLVFLVNSPWDAHVNKQFWLINSPDPGVRQTLRIPSVVGSREGKAWNCMELLQDVLHHLYHFVSICDAYSTQCMRRSMTWYVVRNYWTMSQLHLVCACVRRQAHAQNMYLRTFIYADWKKYTYEQCRSIHLVNTISRTFLSLLLA